MADNQPTEQQQQAMKDASDRAASAWKDDFTDEELLIPYKREATDEKDKSTEGDTGDSAKDASDTDKKDEEVVTYTPPEPVVTATDPGEYVPADYSFEVTLKDGKTVKVSTPDEAEKLADDPDNFETPKQLMDFINKQNKMNRNLERDLEKYEAEKSTFTKQVETETERREQVSNIENEFNYLAGKGLIPKLSAELQAADWRDPEIAKNEDVKVYNDILDYFIEENKSRAKAKVAPMTSMIEAYNAWKADSSVQQAEADRLAAGEARKAASSRIAGSSPAQQGSYVPKGIAVGNPNILKRGAAQWDN